MRTDPLGRYPVKTCQSCGLEFIVVEFLPHRTRWYCSPECEDKQTEPVRES